MGIEHEAAIIIPLEGMNQEEIDQMVRDLDDSAHFVYSVVDPNGYGEFQPGEEDVLWMVGFENAVLGENPCFHTYDCEGSADEMVEALTKAGYGDKLGCPFHGVITH